MRWPVVVLCVFALLRVAGALTRSAFGGRFATASSRLRRLQASPVSETSAEDEDDVEDDRDEEQVDEEEEEAEEVVEQVDEERDR